MTKDPTNPKNSVYIDFISELNVADVTFPCDLKDIKQLIANNENLNANLNLFCWFDNHIYPVETNIGKGNQEINILLVDIPNDEEHPQIYGEGHSILILDMNSFLKQVYHKNGERIGQYSPHWCVNCCTSFGTIDSLQEHKVVFFLFLTFWSHEYLCILILFVYLSIFRFGV